MHDPFRIAGPATISFSGGRTSAYMLWRILHAHDGTLPPDLKACFANTGKEMPETLDFVRDCGEHWGVDIHWLEYRWREGEHFFAEVDHASASRKGEPFELLIKARSALPNVMTRFCTQELKIRTMHRYAVSIGMRDFSNVVGLRADEPARVARMRDRNDSGVDDCEVLMPLHAAGITKRNIETFWRQQNFRLNLASVKGMTPFSNCDLCFLKGEKLISGIMRERPDLAHWWIDKENQTGAKWSKRHRYAQLFNAVEQQSDFDFSGLDQRLDCFCGDDMA